MAYNPSSGSPPQANAPPHIRLNSEDLLSNQPSDPSSVSRQPSSRSLVPQIGATSPSDGGYNDAAAEHLIPPQSAKMRRFRDDDSPMEQSGYSGYSSRRTSWSSDAGSRDSRGYSNPFDDSRAPSRADSDDDNVNTQTVSEKYNILPSAGLLLFPEDVEKDDYLHNPDPSDKDRDCNIWNKRGAVNVGGLTCVTIGVLLLFIGYPILTFAKKLVDNTSDTDPCSSNPLCLDVGDVALLANLRTGLIDPDTPDSAKTKTAADGSTWTLVFSDEFNTDGRTFYEGDDPFFQAMDFWYGVTEDLEWYDPDAVTTADGVLELRFDAFQNHNLNYRSGMVQSWNQLCFKGGRLEASISLPGRGDTVGFWPGFWSMGNLGRPGYAATTDGMWPYSYDDVCDAGITPNQSSPDGINMLPGMRLPACTCSGEQHPSKGKSRTAPEIDVIEASVTYLGADDTAAIGVVSQSLQIAPYDIWYQPNYDFVEVYDTSITTMNSYRGSVYQQAMSGLTNLNNDWYDGNAYQVYAFEYEPGTDGYVTWFVGEDAVWKLDHRAIAPNGNVGQRTIPMEPMSIVMNFGMSDSFSALNLTGLASLMPATMRFDYVRIYQDSDNTIMTCNPEGFPTTSYIANHPEPYANYNLTTWEDAGYSRPTNTLMDDCSE